MNGVIELEVQAALRVPPKAALDISELYELDEAAVEWLESKLFHMLEKLQDKGDFESTRKHYNIVIMNDARKKALSKCILFLQALRCELESQAKESDNEH